MSDSQMPADYASSLDEIAPGISGIVAEQNTGDEPWYDTLSRSLLIITATEQQRAIMQAQIERARAGLPPAPNTALVGQNLMSGTGSVLGWALGIGVALLVFNKLR